MTDSSNSSLLPIAGYSYQQARLQYQYNKLPLIKKGISNPEYGGNIEFELFSFFEICYHLKDWIKESEHYDNLDDVEDFIKQSPKLSICRLICNRLKHKKLKSAIEAKKIGQFNIKSVTELNSSSCDISIQSATIETDHGIECCFTLAKECIQEWNRYFEKNNITKHLVI